MKMTNNFLSDGGAIRGTGLPTWVRQKWQELRHFDLCVNPFNLGELFDLLGLFRLRAGSTKSRKWTKFCSPRNWGTLTKSETRGAQILVTIRIVHYVNNHEQMLQHCCVVWVTGKIRSISRSKTCIYIYIYIEVWISHDITSYHIT